MKTKLLIPALGLALLHGQSGAQKQSPANWSDYGASADSSQYSALRQINKSNVNKLELAWFYPTPGPSGRFAFNPLIVDSVMYVLDPSFAIVALDASTGKKIWSHPVEGTPNDRGINYWESR